MADLKSNEKKLPMANENGPIEMPVEAGDTELLGKIALHSRPYPSR